MPIAQRTIERWTCDRCGTKAEFPDEEGNTALEVGWLRLDLTRSLTAPPPYLFGKNEQILCPADVTNLRQWFEASVPGQEQDREPIRQHMSWVGETDAQREADLRKGKNW